MPYLDFGKAFGRIAHQRLSKIRANGIVSKGWNGIWVWLNNYNRENRKFKLMARHLTSYVTGGVFTRHPYRVDYY